MNYRILLGLSSIALLTGCETLQTPKQRQTANAREQLAARHAEERSRNMQGQVETVQMENARLMQELQQLQSEVRSCNGQIAQLNSSMRSLETKQAREMQELISRVEGLLKKNMAARPAAPSRGSGSEVVVESGYTLSAIAAKCGVTVDAIKRANNLKSDTIYVGQKLFIPE